MINRILRAMWAKYNAAQKGVKEADFRAGRLSVAKRIRKMSWPERRTMERGFLQDQRRHRVLNKMPVHPRFKKGRTLKEAPKLLDNAKRSLQNARSAAARLDDAVQRSQEFGRRLERTRK